MRPGWKRRLLADLRQEYGDVPALDVLVDRVLAEGERQWTPASQVSLAPPARASRGPTAAATPSTWSGPRYERVLKLGQGGMGEVWRVYDTYLGRHVAQKLLAPQLTVLREQFLEEARVTAQLQHPGIVPVYDAGEEDGRLYYTMREVAGRRFGEATEDLPLRRRVDRWARLCAALAYAHAQRVVHGDLSPANVLLGPFGDVLVVDWGLARRIGSTGVGVRGGTRGYAAPESADPSIPTRAALDVYALGALLAGLLEGEDVPPLRSLVEACLGPAEARPTDAGELLTVIEPWLAGAVEREQAELLVAEAQGLLPSLDELRAAATRAQEEARRLLEALPTWAPTEEKARAWQLEDEAQGRRQSALLAEVRFEEALRAAARRAPELPAPRRLLADHYQRRHAEAEHARDPTAPAWEALLRAYDDGRHAAWLQGGGHLSLATDHPATVTLHRFVERGRRLELEVLGGPLPTPIVALPLDRGSYLAVIVAPGRPEVRYPFRIDRGAHWDQVPPGETAPRRVAIPATSGDNEVYVPAGWYRAGDLSARYGLAPRDVWVEGFFLRRDPVTHAEYLAFLNDRVREGLPTDALEPRLRSARPDDLGVAVYHRRPDGQFFLGPDPDGDLPDPAWPVVFVDGAAARAWCRWRAAQDGLPWRLPWELEREKAARGVDGRLFPWGDHAEPTWSRNGMTRPGRALPGRVDETPADVGPYGARGMAGNVRDACLDRFRAGGPLVRPDGTWVPEEATPDDPVVHRGGAWSASVDYGRAGARLYAPFHFRNALVGFRAARTWPPRPEAGAQVSSTTSSPG